MEESKVPVPANSPAKNTRSKAQKLSTEDWMKFPAAQKIHDQVRITILHEEELQGDQNTDPVESVEDYEVVDGKQIRAIRIAATPLKQPWRCPNQPGGR